MAPFLAEEWLERVVHHGAQLPEVPGASATVQHVVSSTPQGRVQAVVEVRDGQVVGARLGKAEDATCTVSWSYDDARAALAGDLGFDVAYMQGRVKVDGDYADVLVGLREVFDSDAGRRFVDAVRRETEW